MLPPLRNMSEGKNMVHVIKNKKELHMLNRLQITYRLDALTHVRVSQRRSVSRE